MTKFKVIIIYFFALFGVLFFNISKLNASDGSKVHWVSPTGTATWANCESAGDPGTNYCSLATANANAMAGDTVYLKGGTYNTHIFPANSGTGLSNRISYIAASGETPIIANTATTYATYYHGIALIGRSYIKISGVRVDAEGTPAGKYRPLMITHGGSYNEIANSFIDGNGVGVIQIWDGGSTPHPTGVAVTHNWLHHNTIADTGSLSWTGSYVNDTGGMQLGVPAYDSDSNNNTIEGNAFYCGGHHNLETFTKYNVIRNNYFHDEGCMQNNTGHEATYGPDTNNLWGNRNIQIYDGYGSDGTFNLLESNKFGHSGPPPDDDGGDGLTITAPKNIIRYNAIFNSLNNGVLFKTGASSLADNNKFYNNTIYKSGRYRNSGPQWQGLNFRWYGSYSRVGNAIKNNILYSFGTGGADWGGGSAAIYSDNSVINNWCTNVSAGKCSSSGDPLFVNTDVSDPFSATLPNLSLQPSSPAINGGTYLIQANGAGSNSITLIVDDAMYFQDGTWGSDLARSVTLFPDWIAIGSVNNAVKISSINYSTNIITLSSSMTWADNAPVWLYKDSSGRQVLYGSAPDYGAYEYAQSSPPADTTPPQAPSGVVVN